MNWTAEGSSKTSRARPRRGNRTARSFSTIPPFPHVPSWCERQNSAVLALSPCNSVTSALQHRSCLLPTQDQHESRTTMSTTSSLHEPDLTETDSQAHVSPVNHVTDNPRWDPESASRWALGCKGPRAPCDSHDGKWRWPPESASRRASAQQGCNVLLH